MMPTSNEVPPISLVMTFFSPISSARYIEPVTPDTGPESSVSSGASTAFATATVLNAYVGPATASYLKNIDERLHALGYRAPLQITQCAGGTISVVRSYSPHLGTSS